VVLIAVPFLRNGHTLHTRLCQLKCVTLCTWAHLVDITLNKTVITDFFSQLAICPLVCWTIDTLETHAELKTLVFVSLLYMFTKSRTCFLELCICYIHPFLYTFIKRMNIVN